MNAVIRRSLLTAGFLTSLDCGPPSAETPDLMTPPDLALHRRLDATLIWFGQNAQHLNDFIAQYGVDGAHYAALPKPVALFDWDNTIIKNDIGDATFFYMVNHDKILQPPSKNWSRTSPYLTADAATALSTACAALAAAGQPLPTSTNVACANEMYSIYDAEKTTGGKAAFAGYNYRRMEPAYAWAVQLSAGYTPEEIQAFADAAISFNMANPIGTTQSVGSNTGLNGYVRVYDQIKDLMGTLQANGFDVWVSSASSQQAVERFAAYVNVAPDHVMGVRLLLDGGGKLTYNLKGCGDVPDGTNDGAGNYTGNSLITYMDGKRCWANKVIWGDDSPAALLTNPDASKRQVFAAGDSNTDVAFVRDASVLKLVINRNKKELMCNGYANFGGKYLINPMFIAGKPQLAAGYPCSTTACVDDKGNTVPCYDEGLPQKLIADQLDTVFAP